MLSESKIMKRIICSFYLVIIILLFLFMIIQFHSYDKVTEFDKSNIEFDDGKVTFYIDSINVERYINITGWAAIKGENINTVNSYYVLRDRDTDKYIKITSSAYERKDLNDFFNDGFDYSHGGISGKVNAKKLDSSHEYEIYILYQNNGYKFLTCTHRIIKIGGEK